MKDKRYILMVETRSKYEGFVKQSYKIFDSYRDLQKHLLRYHNEPVYFIFEETKIKRDNSFIVRSRYL